MFWGLASGKVDPGEFEFEHVLRDIQTLNEWAGKGELEVTAISLHTYPFVQERYVLLPHGAYGYRLRADRRIEDVDPGGAAQTEILIPGRMTTAFLALRLYLGGTSPTARFRSTRSWKR